MERIILECANFLNDRGHETHVYASDWDVESLHNGVIRHHVPLRGRLGFVRMIEFALRIRSEFSLANPRAELFGTFGVQSPPGGVMWVQSVHRAWLDISRNHRALQGRLKQKCNPAHPITLALERYHFRGRRYKKLIALTDDVRADLMRLYDVPATDIVVIPNGFSPSEFNPSRATQMRLSMRAKLGYQPRDKVVIFVANEMERKGFATLLRAVALLDDPSVHVLAIGRLNGAACAGELRRLGLPGRVRFEGSSSDVASYYAAADVFALPTQYEAWGLVIVEAMACGLPVVTSRLAGASIAVREGHTGELLDNPRDPAELARKLSGLLKGGHADRDAISQSVAQYKWERVLLEYERVLIEAAPAKVIPAPVPIAASNYG